MEIEEYADLTELLGDIASWMREQTNPNHDRKYHCCPVCGSTWWSDGLFNVEKHNLGCWVPRLHDEMMQIRQDNAE